MKGGDPCHPGEGRSEKNHESAASWRFEKKREYKKVARARWGGGIRFVEGERK